MRLKARHLPHTISIERFAGDSADGPTWESADTDVPAYVEQKAKLVIDRRSSSTTANQEVMTSNFVVILTSDDVLPESYVTVCAGTARERRAQVITSAFFDYPRAPSHVELYTD